MYSELEIAEKFEILNINPNPWKPCCEYRLVGILPVDNKQKWRYSHIMN